MKARVSTFLAACAVIMLAAISAEAQPRITPPGGGGGGGGQPQSAPSGLLQGTTLEITMEALKQAGYTDVQIYEARSGNKHVAGNVGQTPVSIIHQGCKEGTCPIIMFMVPFGKQETVNASYMNSWNREKLYAKLYADEENNVFFRMDSYLVDIPPQYITRQAQLFAMMLKHVYEYKPGQQN